MDVECPTTKETACGLLRASEVASGIFWVCFAVSVVTLVVMLIRSLTAADLHQPAVPFLLGALVAGFSAAMFWALSGLVRWTSVALVRIMIAAEMHRD